MALLFCRACGLWISAKDDSCPHCDHSNWSAANLWHHLNIVKGWKGHLLYALFELVMCVISLLFLALIGAR